METIHFKFIFRGPSAFMSLVTFSRFIYLLVKHCFVFFLFVLNVLVSRAFTFAYFKTSLVDSVSRGRYVNARCFICFHFFELAGPAIELILFPFYKGLILSCCQI